MTEWRQVGGKHSRAGNTGTAVTAAWLPTDRYVSGSCDPGLVNQNMVYLLYLNLNQSFSNK